MAAVVHGWKPSKGVEVAVEVAKEFNRADEGTGILVKIHRKHGKG